jgi:hypothetical protein
MTDDESRASSPTAAPFLDALDPAPSRAMDSEPLRAHGTVPRLLRSGPRDVCARATRKVSPTARSAHRLVPCRSLCHQFAREHRGRALSAVGRLHRRLLQQGGNDNWLIDGHRPGAHPVRPASGPVRQSAAPGPGSSCSGHPSSLAPSTAAFRMNRCEGSAGSWAVKALTRSSR